MIVGITGQAGSYLAELLLSKGYEVHGLIRRSSNFNTFRIDHIFDQLKLHYGDLSDTGSLISLLASFRPDEIYNLGAQSHVQVSFEIPEYTADITALGVLRLLEAIKLTHLGCKFFQASSSEMFGSSPPPQNENTPFHPCSPYAAAKAFAYYATQNYREAYGMFAVNGIIFNCESPRRGPTFVTRKITRGVAAIVHGKQDKLLLGNLDAWRDWGHARDYVEAMWMMMQRETPQDYVIGTGEMHSVKEFVREAFEYVDLDWELYVKQDEKYFRPSEVHALCADASKARQDLGWVPVSKFKSIVSEMMEADLENG